MGLTIDPISISLSVLILLISFAYMITTACEPVVAQIHLNLLADIVTYPEIESAMVTVPETRLNPLSTTVCVSFQRS